MQSTLKSPLAAEARSSASQEMQNIRVKRPGMATSEPCFSTSCKSSVCTTRHTYPSSENLNGHSALCSLHWQVQTSNYGDGERRSTSLQQPQSQTFLSRPPFSIKQTIGGHLIFLAPPTATSVSATNWRRDLLRHREPISAILIDRCHSCLTTGCQLRNPATRRGCTQSDVRAVDSNPASIQILSALAPRA